MDVRQLLLSEFRTILRRNNIPVTTNILRNAETPFDIPQIQYAVDDDLDEIRRRNAYLSADAVERLVREREEFHKRNLTKLTQQYARRIATEYRIEGMVTARAAQNQQRVLKEATGDGCDAYPCERQQRAR